MTNVVIASAARTPVGSFSGSFATTPAHDLGAAMLEALVERANHAPVAKPRRGRYVRVRCAFASILIDPGDTLKNAGGNQQHDSGCHAAGKQSTT